jgi:small subunit ribosomal protein S1
MTLFEDANAPYSDSNTTTLTEPQPELQPTSEAQAEQPEQVADAQQDHDQQAQSEQAAQPSQAQLGDSQSSEKTHAQSGDERPAATEDFGSVLDSFTAEAEEAASDDHVLKGTVLKLTSTHVVVDIGAKSEGMLPLAEVLDHEGKPRFKPGDEIDVMRDKGPSEEGYINLSFLKAQRLRAWDDIDSCCGCRADQGRRHRGH